MNFLSEKNKNPDFIFNLYFDEHVLSPFFTKAYFENFGFKQRKLIISCLDLITLDSQSFLKNFNFIEITNIRNLEQFKFSLKLAEIYKIIISIDSKKILNIILNIDSSIFNKIKYFSIDRNKLVRFKTYALSHKKLNDKSMEKTIISIQNIGKLIIKGNVNIESIAFNNINKDFAIETRFILTLETKIDNSFFIKALSYELNWLKYKELFFKSIFKNDFNRITYLQERYRYQLNSLNTRKPKFGDNFIFDLDGTLINSITDINKYFYLTIENLSLNLKDSPNQFIGLPIKRLFELCIENPNPKIIANCVKVFRSLYDNSLHENTHEFPFTSDVLTTLSKNNCKLYLVTNKPSLVTKKILKKLNLYNFFLNIYCLGDKSFNNKISVIKKIIIQKKLVRKNTWVVGDSIEDIEAANKNEISFIYHQSGYGDLYSKVNKYPDIVIKSIRDLSNMMTNL